MHFQRALGLLCLLLFALAAHGQTESCNCSANLQQLIVHSESDYAGFIPKTSGNKQAAYLQLKTNLQQQATITTTPRQCFALLEQYVQFFADKHFVAYYYNEQDKDSVVMPMPAAKLKPAKAGELLPSASVWLDADSSRRILLLRQANGSYQALKMASKTDHYPPGYVYFTLTPKGNLWWVTEADNRKSSATPARLTGGLLQIASSAMYAIQQPGKLTAAELAEWQSWRQHNQGLYFAMLDAQTAYLRISSFANNESAIAELIARHDSTIRHTPYLILDIRGNMGGSTGWVSLLPYIMTQPILQQPSLLRVSAFNVKNKLPELEPFATGPIPAEYQKYFPDSTLQWYKRAYTELPQAKGPYYAMPAVNFPLDSITRYPQKVALMVDERCGSSAEYFLHLSRQSGKLKSYGAPTWGMMDYEGASVLSPMPCNHFRVAIPPSQSSWTSTQPIDDTGMMPDVWLKQPYHQWLEEVRKRLPRQ